MIHPYQCILVAPELQRRVENGTRNITIRRGRRAYRAGEYVYLCCHITSWCVRRMIDSVKFCKLKHISESDCIDFSCYSPEEVAEFMSKFYPDIKLDNDVTVIRWNYAVC